MSGVWNARPVSVTPSRSSLEEVALDTNPKRQRGRDEEGLITLALADAEKREQYRYFLCFTSYVIQIPTGRAYDLYLESYHHR